MDYKFEGKLLGVLGDVHGEFQEILNKLRSVENSVVVVAGDVGFGFPDTRVPKLLRMFEKNFDKFLTKRNIYLMFMRGNHDNPRYFQSPIKDDLSSSNIKVLEDYDTITLDNFKILCVGGGISIDRVSREIEKSYWADEPPVFKDLGLGKIDLLITHSIFSHPNVEGKTNIDLFLKYDYSLKDSLKQESDTIFKIVERYKPKAIIHGHMHKSYNSEYNGIVLRGLGICELLNIRIDE